MNNVYLIKNKSNWQEWLNPFIIAKKNNYLPINKKSFQKNLKSILVENKKLSELRPSILNLYKKSYSEGFVNLKNNLYLNKDGIKFVGCYAIFIDFLINNLFVSLKNKYFINCEPISIIALGGYGRGELCPYSDIDLLFLVEDKISKDQKHLIEFILYILWDLDLKVGNSTRSIVDNITLSKNDFTIRTSLLEMRLVAGDKTNYLTLEKTFFNWIKKESVSEFVKRKLNERDNRINILGSTRYAVEPNIKEGKGGLRDLHTLFWITKYAYNLNNILDILDTKVLNITEVRAFARAKRFLLTTRCFLHFHHIRENDNLTFDAQIEIAPKLGFFHRGGLKDVERFMKRYFLAAKQVGNLTRTFCSVLQADLSDRPFLKIRKFFINENLKNNLKPFIIENKRLKLPDDVNLVKNSNLIVKLFEFALIYQIDVHPATVRKWVQYIKVSQTKDLQSELSSQVFLRIISSKQNSERILRLMNETGWLGKYFPDFGKIVGMMQFDMYHHYTVDEHTIKAIGILSEIEKGNFSNESLLSSTLIHQIVSRRALYLAVFFHDIAKGREGDHSEIGAKIFEKYAKLLNLDAEEIETIGWLIKNHLLLSKTAFRYDLNDPKTIKDFVDKVQSPERLKLLLVLTSADIRAVGPNIWNSWKSSLIRTLYKKTEIVIGGIEPTEALISISQGKIKNFKRFLNSKNFKEVQTYIELFYPGYWINFSEETLLEHFHLFYEKKIKKDNLIINFKTDEINKVTRLTVIASDHPGLFSRIAGSVSIAGCSILNAIVNTRKDGLILDEFILQNKNQEAIKDEFLLKKLKENIKNSLAGNFSLYKKVMEKNLNLSKRELAMKIMPRVIITNSKSFTHTVIEVNGSDRPGLLYQITYHLTHLGLQINSASVSTYGEKVVDVFYVKDIFGHQVQNKSTQNKIKKTILSIFDSQI